MEAIYYLECVMLYVVVPKKKIAVFSFWIFKFYEIL